MKVSIYVRLSEDSKGTGLGVQRQEKECREFAEQKGWTVERVFTDNDLSATTGIRRPGFEELLANKPQAIVCWHIDRLVRLSKDLERVIELGVNVHAVQAGHLDLSTPAGRAVAKTVTAWAQYEGEQKAERQMAAHRQRVGNGGLSSTGRPWWPTRPLGFNEDGTHHEVEAPALAQVYSDILRGGTLAAATRYLDSQGIVAARSGKAWKASSLRPALLNARNAGIVVYKGEEVGPAAWEPIVTEDVFRAVVRILTNPARRLTGDAPGGFGHRTNLLTGLAVCSRCDHTVRAAWRRNLKGERTYKVYQCGGCHGTTVPAEWADSVVTRKVIERAEQWQDFLPQSARNEADLAGLRDRLKALESSKAEIVEDRALGLLTREQLAMGLAHVDAEIVKVTDQLTGYAVDSAGIPLWDVELLWEWTDDGEGNLDVERFTPVVKRLCSRVTLTGPGKGRKDLRYGEHLLIDFKES